MKQRTRQACVMHGSLVCLITNLILFLIKITVGSLSGSMSVTADAFNNLSDMGSGAVTLIGTKLASRPSDKEHPFGHGRIEYIAALIVSFIILFLALELIGSAFSKILSPSPVHFSGIAIVLLLLSILAKLFLGFYCHKLGEKANSPALIAAGKDSLSDVLVTGATLLSAFLSFFTDFPLDGYLALAVSVIVIRAAVGILRDTLGPLLGQAPSGTLSSEIQKIILSCPGVTGSHDLIVHNYGPERYIASVHAEVRADCDILKMHDAIDLTERRIMEELGVLITVHLDPIDTDDALTNTLREMVISLVREIDPALSIHDFRIVSGDTHTNLIFDLVLPASLKIKEQALADMIDKKLKTKNPGYFCVITFDRDFISE